MSHLRAAAWMSGAIVSFTSMAIAGRAVSHQLDTFEIMLFRSLIGIVLVVVISSSLGTFRDIQANRLGLHLLRNIFHFTGQNLWFYALPLIPLAQLFALEFTSPIWVVLLAPLFLGEALTGRKILVAILGFVGVLIVARPDMNALNIGIVAGGLAAIGFAGTAIVTRKLTADQNLTTILFFLTTMQAVFGLMFAGYDGDIAIPTLSILPWIILIGFAGLTAHFCMTKSLSMAPASIVMPVDFVRLPVIMVIGMMFYNEVLDAWVILGAAIIIAANYLNLRKPAP